MLDADVIKGRASGNCMGMTCEVSPLLRKVDSVCQRYLRNPCDEMPDDHRTPKAPWLTRASRCLGALAKLSKHVEIESAKAPNGYVVWECKKHSTHGGRVGQRPSTRSSTNIGGYFRQPLDPLKP